MKYSHPSNFIRLNRRDLTGNAGQENKKLEVFNVRKAKGEKVKGEM